MVLDDNLFYYLVCDEVPFLSRKRLISGIESNIERHYKNSQTYDVFMHYLLNDATEKEICFIRENSKNILNKLKVEILREYEVLGRLIPTSLGCYRTVEGFQVPLDGTMEDPEETPYCLDDEKPLDFNGDDHYRDNGDSDYL